MKWSRPMAWFVVAVSVCTLSLAAPPKQRPRAAAAANSMAGVARQPLAGEFQARSADDFLNSVGVCAHLGRVATVYVQQFPQIEKLLLESGIRHMRCDPISAPQAIANVRRLGEKGVRFDFIIHAENTADVQRMLANVKTNFLPYTEMIEGPNEPDDRADNARTRMQEIYKICKSDPAFKNIPVLGCALANPSGKARQFGDCTAFVDLGNIHAYPGGRAPEISLPLYVGYVQPQYPGKKYMITETGYHSALDNPPNKHRPTPEPVQAVYMPRLYLEYFKNGILRSYKYQLADDRTDAEARGKGQPVQEAHFGLIDLNMKPKPSYNSIKNLMTILADRKSEGFQPQSLGYAVDGPRDELRHLLLQKSNGDFYLAVWRAVPIWDMDKRVMLPIVTKKAAVELKQPAKEVQLFRPTKSAEAYESLKNAKSIPLALDADVVILKISDK